MPRNGGQILIDALRLNGCRAIFGVPGESYLAALDAMHGAGNAIRYITCRQEGGAGFMAAAHADATGEAGVCFVTRGPGASNAAIALHTAHQGSTPLILLVGQIPSGQRDREAFQEIDYRRMFAQSAKWIAEIDRPERIPEYLNRAYRTALSGRPGPVVLALPEDVCFAEAEVADLAPARLSPVAPDPAALERVQALLRQARRPLLLLGGSAWTEEGYRAIQKAATAFDLPVAVGFRRHGLFPNDHPSYVGNAGYGGNPEPNRTLRRADLVVALGGRLDDGTTLKFSLLTAPKPACRLVHVHPGAEELGRLYQADLLIQADPSRFAAALAAAAPPDPLPWAGHRAAARTAFEAMQDQPPQAGPVDMGAVMAVLNRRLPADSFVTTGAGNAADWPNVHYCYRSFRCGLAPISGAMGFGVPAAIAAKVADPARPAIYIGGDGDFLMNGQELATAVQHGLDPLFIIVDNAMYGTIRMNQERRYPGRPTGTALANPDFAAVARGYGAHGETVARTEDFEPAFERARASGKAAVIHIQVGPEHLGPNMTVAGLAEGQG